MKYRAVNSIEEMLQVAKGAAIESMGLLRKQYGWEDPQDGFSLKPEQERSSHIGQKN